MSAQDTLFLLDRSFPDAKAGEGQYFCPDCIGVEGLLTAFPQLRSLMKVEHVPFPRPRPAVIARLGEAHQGCPVLVVVNPSVSQQSLLQQSPVTQAWFASGFQAIATYCSVVHGTPAPHP